MAVEDFMNVKDAKKIVEKSVKPKLTMQELTTIEYPGRPSSASMLQNPDENQRPKTKQRKRRAKTARASAMELVTKDAIIIITEKPQAAQKIAMALGQPRKLNDNKVPYYELTDPKSGEKLIVASAVGHLFNLNYKEGQRGWPIFELEWEPSFNKKSAAFTKRYYALLKKLSKHAKEVIIATDYDIEGEVIGWNVLRFIFNQDNAKRMKYSTLTKPELIKSYENPEENLNWQNAYAGETRHILDWLYGINLSRALMSAVKTAGSFRILSIGRVQGPALKIIVDREKEISKFKSKPFGQVFALTNSAKGVEFKHPKDIFNKRELDKFSNLENTEANAETKKSEEKIHPPVPFDLTSLQREAYRFHKISPSQTLATAQKLYLAGLISYPRTSSQKIPEAIEPKQILQQLKKHFPKEISIATRSRPIEGKKSDPAHPSIYPTGEYQDLAEDDAKIYNLIARRFISAFSPDAITHNKRITLEAKDNLKFTATGLTLVEKGWTQVYPAKIEERSIPDLDGKVIIKKINIVEKETQPPKRYTPASLITTLEKKDLGTKATRSIIVDTLFDRGYLDGQSIKATSLGLKLIETLEKYSPIIIDENLTRQFEDEMNKIQTEKVSTAEYKKDEDEVVAKAKKLISNISKEFKQKESEIGKELLKSLEEHREAQKEANMIMPCPTCKKGQLRITYNKNSRRYFISCTKYPECTQTYNLPPNALIKNTGKVSENNLPILIAIRKGKRPWEFPFNPNWKQEQEQNQNSQYNNQKDSDKTTKPYKEDY